MSLPKSFWLLWCGQTLGRSGMLAPAFLVLYLEGDGLVDKHTTPVVVGLFAAGVVVGGLVGGVLSDLMGARRTIVAAQPTAVAVALAFILAGDIYTVGALALVAGFLTSVDRAANAGIVAAVVPQELFSRAYSILLVGFNVGMSAGPVLAGLLLTLYPPALFLLWALTSVSYGLFVWALPADAPAPAQSGSGGAARRVVSGIVEPFRTPVLLAFLVLTFLIACIYLQVNSALPLDMSASGLSPVAIGIVLAVNAVLMVVLLPLGPKLAARMRDETPLVLAAALIAVGFGLNAVADGFVMFTVAVVVWTLGEVMFAPMSATFLAKRAPAGRIGVYQGSFFFAWNAAFVVGGPAGITIAQARGYDLLWIICLLLGAAVAVGYRLMARIPGFDAVPAPPADDVAAVKLAQAEGEDERPNVSGVSR
jgi:MFS family permease